MRISVSRAVFFLPAVCHCEERYYCIAMQPSDVVTAVVIGCALIALGLTPGLFQGLTDGVLRALLNFRNTLSSPIPIGLPRQPEYKKPHRSPWLAGIGLGLILLSLFGYLTK